MNYLLVGIIVILLAGWIRLWFLYRNKQKNVAALQADLQASQNKAKTMAEEINAVCYSISHDLNAPLRAVDGFAKILERDYYQTLDKNGKEFIAFIRDSANLLKDLIESVLILSRLGRKKLRITDVDMIQLAKEAHQQMQSKTKRQVRLRLPEKGGPLLNGDRDMLLRAWIFLFDNAFTFTRNTENPLIQISASQENHELIYAIKDNGMGVNPERAGQLFQLFHKAHTQEEGSGNGAGLAYVHRIVQRHGGRVWADGTVGMKAVFYMAFPAVSNQARETLDPYGTLTNVPAAP